MTMKRRIIYLSDEQWTTLHEQAREERSSISALIRSRMALEATQLHAALGLGDDVHVEMDTRPVVTFRPVPKPSKRR